MACHEPGVGWSEMTSRTPCRPRAFRLSRKRVQNDSSSLSPTSKPRTSRVPSAVHPVAAHDGLETNREPSALPGTVAGTCR